MRRSDPSYKGQSGYNPALLAIYDVWVLKFMARAVWKCPIPPDGVLFGGTVLGTREPHTRAARVFLWAFNKEGGFDNRDDTAEGLHGILDASFRHVEVERSGSIALFSASGRRSA